MLPPMPSQHWFRPLWFLEGSWTQVSCVSGKYLTNWAISPSANVSMCHCKSLCKTVSAAQGILMHAFFQNQGISEECQQWESIKHSITRASLQSALTAHMPAESHGAIPRLPPPRLFFHSRSLHEWKSLYFRFKNSAILGVIQWSFLKKTICFQRWDNRTYILWKRVRLLSIKCVCRALVHVCVSVVYSLVYYIGRGTLVNNITY